MTDEPVPTAAPAPEATPRALLPGHADRVVVPLANPASAGDLLAMAAAMCAVGGRVTALTLALDDAAMEASREGAAALAAVVEEAAARYPDRRVELVAQPATSVARGILEMTREVGADLLVLGIPMSSGDDSLLGPVADALIDIAPCDVMLVRPGQGAEQVGDAQRVTVTVDGDDVARTAARTGVVLGDGLGLPVRVVHVQDAGRPAWDGYAVLARSLADVDGGAACERELLRGASVADTVVASSSTTDLLVVGLEHEGTLQRWLFGSVSSDLLRRAVGPVVVVARQVPEEGLPGRVQRITRWLRPRLTPVEQETLLWAARRNGTTTIDYLTLLTLSAVLASLGLVQNSVAVIIGAMLVAPLLGPLSAISIGLITARTPLLRRAVLTLAIGSGAGALVGLVIGLVVPMAGPTGQMALRGAPSLLDVGVAIASGLVGAYATARKDIPAALAGVAIAAALVPPLCTVGLGAAIGRPSLAFGALLLFLVNVSAVIVTGAAAFWWFGMHPVEQDADTRRRIVSAATAAGLVLLVVTTTVGLLQVLRATELAAQDVRAVLSIGEDVEVITVEVGRGTEPIDITVTVRSEHELDPADLVGIEEGLESELGIEVDLRVIVQLVLTPQRTDGA